MGARGWGRGQDMDEAAGLVEESDATGSRVPKVEVKAETAADRVGEQVDQRKGGRMRDEGGS